MRNAALERAQGGAEAWSYLHTVIVCMAVWASPSEGYLPIIL